MPEKSSAALKELITIKSEELVRLKSRSHGAVVINTSSFLFGRVCVGDSLMYFQNKILQDAPKGLSGPALVRKRGSSGDGLNDNAEPRRCGAGGERGRESSR